jgi:hypothetical protein
MSGVTKQAFFQILLRSSGGSFGNSVKTGPLCSSVIDSLSTTVWVDSVAIAPIVAEDSRELSREGHLEFDELENVELVSIARSYGATSKETVERRPGPDRDC